MVYRLTLTNSHKLVVQLIHFNLPQRRIQDFPDKIGEGEPTPKVGLLTYDFG